jgi:hypothetical protein
MSAGRSPSPAIFLVRTRSERSIGTDLASQGRIAATGNIGDTTIKRSIIGGDDPRTGSLEAGGRIKSVAIRGSVEGGTGAFSGSIIARTYYRPHSSSRTT